MDLFTNYSYSNAPLEITGDGIMLRDGGNVGQAGVKLANWRISGLDYLATRK